MPATPASEPDRATPPAAGERLPTFLCFAVYSANLAFGRAYKPLLDALGLTYTQYIALVALADSDDLTVGALGERLFLESNTLTPILKKLETLGFVERRRDPADERQVRLTLTPAGRDVVAQEPGSALLEAIGLNGDDFAAVRESVVRVRNNLLGVGRPDTAHGKVSEM